jgi:hypothetical protein
MAARRVRDDAELSQGFIAGAEVGAWSVEGHLGSLAKDRRGRL